MTSRATGAEALNLRFLDTPPMTSAALGMVLVRSCSYCSWTCMASSRVGNRTSALAWRRRLALQHFDHRNQKRQRLAGAGLGGADYVFAFEGGRNGALLDRG